MMQNQEEVRLASKIPKFPVGFRFMPDAVDVVERYLSPRVLQDIRAPAYLIRECDVYQHDPWDLFQLHHHPSAFKYSDDNMYFFSPRHHAGGSSSTHRTSRIAGSGFWAHGKDESIKKGGRVIGHKRQLTFKKLEGKKMAIKTDWLMHEFRLAGGGKLEELVLCRIYPKKSYAGQQAPQVDTTTLLQEGDAAGNDQKEMPPPALLLPGPPPSAPAAKLDGQEFDWDAELDMCLPMI